MVVVRVELVWVVVLVAVVVDGCVSGRCLCLNGGVFAGLIPPARLPGRSCVMDVSGRNKQACRFPWRLLPEDSPEGESRQGSAEGTYLKKYK